MDTTLIRRTTRVQRTDSGSMRSFASLLRRVQTSIVSGPSDGCWRPAGPGTPLVLLSARQRDRLLAAGRVPNHR